MCHLAAAGCIILVLLIRTRHGMQVLKIAILAERDADDYSFYVDIILNLIRVAGDYVSAEAWPALPVATLCYCWRAEV